MVRAESSREPMRIEDGRRVHAAAVLRSHRMPEDEIRVLVTTEDPDLVRRVLELHEERLEEELATRRGEIRLAAERLAAAIGEVTARPCDQKASGGTFWFRWNRFAGS